MDNISVHGESAIGQAKMGRRQKDTHQRVGVMLGALLCVGSFVFALTRPGGGSWILLVLLVSLSIITATAVATLIGRRNQRIWAVEERESRALRAAEKARQLEEFMASREQH